MTALRTIAAVGLVALYAGAWLILGAGMAYAGNIEDSV